MILKSPTSRLSLVNLFADFILNQIPSDEETIIQVVDCLNFYVIKGKTTHTEPLNIGKLKDEFNIKFEDLIGDTKMTHTIDLIEYDSKLSTIDSLTHVFHNTLNCSYNQSQVSSFINDNTLSYDYQYFLKFIDNNQIFCSEFPHGHSLSQGRLLYYYGKHIFYNIPSSYPVKTLVFELSNQKDESGDYKFSVKNTSGEIDGTLTSAILDVFDFETKWIEEEIKKVDWFIEITDPLSDYNFLKKKVKDFIIF